MLFSGTRAAKGMRAEMSLSRAESTAPGQVLDAVTVPSRLRASALRLPGSAW